MSEVPANMCPDCWAQGRAVERREPCRVCANYLRHVVPAPCKCGRPPVGTSDSSGMTTYRCDTCGIAETEYSRPKAAAKWNRRQRSEH